ncbi:hypothetical protein SUGI_1521820 [Cryptomeria japonica]|uniref:TIR domain-containing protein n=2 Tax=Cryptomeria japonica TaxID=3369 RepID=A0AAD3NUV9_CRYJA|nr:uncharacterized protein LOC131873527 isoform X2 [Cryptomeria japonica]GLJ59748.1 hypothetical protein SUGI_1521820 [Cryptomeria japonica]
MPLLKFRLESLRGHSVLKAGKRSRIASLSLLPPSASDQFSSLYVRVSKMARRIFFRRKSSNAMLSAWEEKESMMGPAVAQRNGSVPKDVFLCQSGKQKVPVRELHKELTNKGVSCFVDEDPQSLSLAENFPARIFEAAEKCRVAVLVISKDIIHSKWPLLELSNLLKAKSSD